MKSMIWKSEDGLSVNITYDNEIARRTVGEMRNKYIAGEVVKIDGEEYAIDGYNNNGISTTFYLTKLKMDTSYNLTDMAEKELAAMGVAKITDIPNQAIRIVNSSIGMIYKGEIEEVIPIEVTIEEVVEESNLQFILKAYDLKAEEVKNFKMKDISEVY